MHDSAFGRLLGVLVSPGQTFRSIAARPSFWAALLVLAILGALVGYTVNQRLDMEQMLRHRAERQHQELSQEDIDRTVTMMKKVGPVSTLVGFLVLLPGAYLLLAVVFWVAFRLLGSESLTYPQSLSVTLHSLMPLAVSYLLTLPLVLGRKTIGFQDTQRGILLSNPAILAPEGTKPAVVALLGSLDFFTLWTLVLLALGYRAVAKVSGTAATATVLVLWLLFVGIKVGIAAVFG